MNVMMLLLLVRGREDSSFLPLPLALCVVGFLLRLAPLFSEVLELYERQEKKRRKRVVSILIPTMIEQSKCPRSEASEQNMRQEEKHGNNVRSSQLRWRV
jgi:hypothetical protein